MKDKLNEELKEKLQEFRHSTIESNETENP